MKIVFLDGPRTYDGRQLSTAFIDEHVGAAGDAMVLFVGPADVPLEHMVDLEDVEAERPIYGPRMAHVLVEHRDMDLRAGVLAQRLLVRLAADFVGRRSGAPVEVRGDDLFVGAGKLSVSVATRSPRGVLIHLGVNVETEGTPVRTVGLRDLRLPARDFLRALGRGYADEYASVLHAASKVRPVP